MENCPISPPPQKIFETKRTIFHTFPKWDIGIFISNMFLCEPELTPPKTNGWIPQNDGLEKVISGV